MPADIQNILKTIKAGIVELASSSLKEFTQDAIADGQAIVNGIEPKLKKWTEQVALGQMTQADLKDLVLGEKDNIQLTALKHKGIAMAKADKFKADVLNLVINTVAAAI